MLVDQFEGNPRYAFLLARLSTKAGKLDDAEKVLRKLVETLERSSDKLDARAELARITLLRGDKAGGLDQLGLDRLGTRGRGLQPDDLPGQCLGGGVGHLRGDDRIRARGRHAQQDGARGAHRGVPLSLTISFLLHLLTLPRKIALTRRKVCLYNILPLRPVSQLPSGATHL